MKNIYTLIFLSGTITSINQLSAESIPALTPIQQAYTSNGKDNGWKYVEFLFNVEPKDFLNKKLSQKQASLALIASIIALSYIPADYCVKHYLKGFDIKNYSYPLSFAALLLITRYYMEYATNNQLQSKYQVLFEVISEWPSFRTVFPDELTPLFDELYYLYEINNKDEFFDLAANTLLIIQHNLEHIFEKRYTNNKAEVDALSTVKTITDIRKNI